MEKITITREELQELIRDAVKQEIETTKTLNNKSSSYIFQGILDDYIKGGGKLSNLVGTRTSWKLWEVGIRKLVVTAMGKSYVRNIEDTERAKKLAEDIIEVLINHYEQMQEEGLINEWWLWNTHL